MCDYRESSKEFSENGKSKTPVCLMSVGHYFESLHSIVLKDVTAHY